MRVDYNINEIAIDKILELCEETRGKMLRETDDEEVAAIATQCLASIRGICNNVKKSIEHERDISS